MPGSRAPGLAGLRAFRVAGLGAFRAAGFDWNMHLLRARQQAGMMQADVAASMGVAQAAVARLDLGPAAASTPRPSLRCGAMPTRRAAICI